MLSNMLTTEKRIALLEASASDNGIKIVIVLDGETQADALKRVGLPPDAQAMYFAPINEKL